MFGAHEILLSSFDLGRQTTSVLVQAYPACAFAHRGKIFFSVFLAVPAIMSGRLERLRPELSQELVARQR